MTRPGSSGSPPAVALLDTEQRLESWTSTFAAAIGEDLHVGMALSRLNGAASATVQPLTDGRFTCTLNLHASSRARARLARVLEQVLDDMPHVVAVKSSDGVYVWCNKASEMTLGAGVIGKHTDEIFDAEAAARNHRQEAELLSHGGVHVDDESRIVGADGEVRLMRTKKFVVGDDDETRHVVTISEDVSERHAQQKALEEAIEAAKAASIAKSTFLATMSHEIRTPLNGVLGMAQAMSLDALEPLQRERLETIRQSGEALLAILNDVLDLSKIEAGKLEFETIPFDLGEVARGAYAAFTQIANKKGISFALSIDGAEGVYLGDPTRLRQILYNLISNALKFTETGEIRVSAAFARKALTLTVSDTGIGMSSEVISKLFNKFTQAEASTTRRFGGTGLGLAICWELAELMGGRITVESAEGVGSTFRLTLPIRRVGDSAASEGAHGAQQDNALAHPLRVRLLAAEDNKINQLVLRTLLQQVGIDPVIVGDGLEAVEAWRTGAFDAVLLDVQMPHMDGPTAAREIRRLERQEGLPRTPLIALTANVMSHQISAYYEAGMDAHVGKPLQADTLFTTLAQVLEDAEEDRCDQTARTREGRSTPQ